MFLGHLPAGYVLTKTLQKKFKTAKYLLIGLIASILPDADLFYFYLVDEKQHLHHSYWIHTPFYWVVIATITFPLLWFFKKKDLMVGVAIFFSNVFLHLFLDTIVGKIEWLFPLTEKAYYIFEVPDIYNFWVYNFIFHWTFLFEIAVMVWATYILCKQPKS